MTVILREDKDTKRWFVGYLVRPDGGGHEFDSWFSGKSEVFRKPALTYVKLGSTSNVMLARALLPLAAWNVQTPIVEPADSPSLACFAHRRDCDQLSFHWSRWDRIYGLERRVLGYLRGRAIWQRSNRRLYWGLYVDLAGFQSSHRPTRKCLL